MHWRYSFFTMHWWYCISLPSLIRFFLVYFASKKLLKCFNISNFLTIFKCQKFIVGKIKTRATKFKLSCPWGKWIEKKLIFLLYCNKSISCIFKISNLYLSWDDSTNSAIRFPLYLFLWLNKSSVTVVKQNDAYSSLDRHFQ